MVEVRRSGRVESARHLSPLLSLLLTTNNMKVNQMELTYAQD